MHSPWQRPRPARLSCRFDARSSSRGGATPGSAEILHDTFEQTLRPLVFPVARLAIGHPLDRLGQPARAYLRRSALRCRPRLHALIVERRRFPDVAGEDLLRRPDTTRARPRESSTESAVRNPPTSRCTHRLSGLGYALGILGVQGQGSFSVLVRRVTVPVSVSVPIERYSSRSVIDTLNATRRSSRAASDATRPRSIA